MKRLVSSLGALALVAVLVPAAASAQMGNMPEGREVTVQGTVVDLDCKFRNGQSGEGHREWPILPETMTIRPERAT